MDEPLRMVHIGWSRRTGICLAIYRLRIVGLSRGVEASLKVQARTRKSCVVIAYSQSFLNLRLSFPISIVGHSLRIVIHIASLTNALKSDSSKNISIKRYVDAMR